MLFGGVLGFQAFFGGCIGGLCFRGLLPLLPRLGFELGVLCFFISPILLLLYLKCLILLIFHPIRLPQELWI